MIKKFIFKFKEESEHEVLEASSITWAYFSTSVTGGVTLILGTISGIIAARLLGPAGRGELALISYFPALMGSLFSLGIHDALTFFISKDVARRQEIITAGIRLSFILGIFGAVTFAVIAPRTLSAHSHNLYFSIMIACLFAPVMVIKPYMEAIIWGMNRFQWCNSMRILGSILFIILIVGLWASHRVSSLGIALSAITAYSVATFLDWWRLGFAGFQYRVKWETYRMLLIQGLKFFMPFIAALLFTMSDQAILMRMTTLREIGYYAVAFAVAYPLMVITESFAQIGFVEIAGTADIEKSTILAIRRFQMGQVVAIAAGLTLLLLVNNIIIVCFGKDFAPAVIIAIFMVPAMTIRGLSRLLDFILRARGHTLPGSIYNIIALVILIGFSIMIVPHKGAAGFAVALLFAQIIGLAALILCTCHFLEVSPVELWGIRKNVIASLVRNCLDILNRKK